MGVVAALALGGLLTACGGGGGGGVESVNLSTPENTAQALVPILTVATGGAGAVSRSASAHQSSQANTNRWTGVSAKRAAVMPKAATPCPTSGSYEYGQFEDKNVDSPFTESNFAGETYVANDCKSTEGGYVSTDDGRSEYGYAVDNENISYERDGTSSSPYVESWTYTTEGYQESGRFASRGTTHTEYADGFYDDRIDYNIKFEYSAQEGGDTFRDGFSAFFGTGDEPFQMVSSDTTLSLDGVYGIESSHYPDCELGKARVLTPDPLTYDVDTGNLVGLIQISAGGRDADVLLKADGSADVTIGEVTTTLTALEIEALVDACPDIGD